MSKKEFLKRVKRTRRRLSNNEYSRLTEFLIYVHISKKAGVCYRDCIIPLPYDYVKDSSYYRDKSEYPMLLRCMLTEAFFDECLESGKYKEF